MGTVTQFPCKDADIRLHGLKFEPLRTVTVTTTKYVLRVLPTVLILDWVQY